MDTGPSNKSSPNTISDNQMDHRVDYEMSSVRENEELRTVMLRILIYRGERVLKRVIYNLLIAKKNYPGISYLLTYLLKVMIIGT